MDYTIRYGLEFNPFLKNSKKSLYQQTNPKKFIVAQLSRQKSEIFIMN